MKHPARQRIAPHIYLGQLDEPPFGQFAGLGQAQPRGLAPIGQPHRPVGRGGQRLHARPILQGPAQLHDGLGQFLGRQRQPHRLIRQRDPSLVGQRFELFFGGMQRIFQLGQRRCARLLILHPDKDRSGLAGPTHLHQPRHGLLWRHA